MASTPALRIVRAGPGATIQDEGRPGRLHEGLPPGGALVPELLRAAREALGSDPRAAAIEVFLHPLTVIAERALTCSVDGRLHFLAKGDELVVSPGNEAVSYLALPGGVDVPEVLGGRGTLVSARLGGFQGRMLKTGDVLACTDEEIHAREVPAPPLDEAPVRLVPGPDAFSERALDQLFSGTFRIAAALDRTGVRLEGPKLETPRDRPFSTPMIRGAMQVSHDGTPIVLGPDHPTTGGYPVIATVLTADLGRLARKRPGSEVRFTRA